MQRTLLGRTATRVILLCGICVLVSQERFQGAVAPTTFYVLGGGAGNCSGIDWSNAAGAIPAVLNPGDVVFIGNSGKNLADATTIPCPGEPNHTFSTSGSAGSHITIKAATAVDHGTATGWAASMGVDVNPKITWSNAFAATDGLKNPFWDFCGNYYDVDGKVGASDQTGTYGFYFKSAGRMFGFIRVDTAPCASSLTDYTFNKIELDGVDAASSVVLGTGAVNTNGTTVTWVSDAVGSPRSHFDTSTFWNGQQITVNGTIKTVSTVGSATSLTLTTSIGVLNGVNYTVAQPGAGGFYLGSPVSITASVSNVSITNSYLHDIFGPISSAGRTIGLTLSNSWVYADFSDAAEHSNAIDTQASNNDAAQIGIQNLTVNSVVFKNIQGTAFIDCLSGICDGWKAYNNIFYYTSNWDSICEHSGDTTATCGVSKTFGDNAVGSILTNATFHGNTIANIHTKPGHPGADESGVVIQVAGSTGNSAQNNLWWNCTAGDIFQDSKVTHNYNTWVNTGNGSTTVAANEAQIGTGPGGVGVNPFVSAIDFHLVSESVDANLNNGVPLASPYNFDYAGLTRSADRTWERGAYEFKLGGTTTSASPTNLLVTGFR